MTRVAERRPERQPALTVAIPAYANWAHLLVCLKSLVDQTSDDLEIVVSDDSSPTDETESVIAVLEGSRCAFQVHRQAANLGYDGNVRFCLRAARGRHILYLGHDDALASPGEAEALIDALATLGGPDVAFTNFEDWATGQPTVRASATSVLGSGADVAVRHFRTFSFVGGLIFKRETVLRHDGDQWDGSIYVQIFLACRTLTGGGRLAAIARTSVRKDIRVSGETVENYASKLAGTARTMTPWPTGLDMVAKVTIDAVRPGVGAAGLPCVASRVARELLLFSYLFWLLEYRRVGGFAAGVGVARTMSVKDLLAGVDVGVLDRVRLHALFVAVTVIGLTVPSERALDAARNAAAAVRRHRQRADDAYGSREAAKTRSTDAN